MLFRPYRPGTIQIDSSGVSSSSEQIERRLNRIADNYRQLEALLAEVESRLPSEVRLEVNASPAEIDSPEPAAQSASTRAPRWRRKPK